MMNHCGIPNQSSTLVDLLCWRAHHQPLQEAYTFLHDENNEGVRINYAELDLRARTIGEFLQNAGLEGKRALLLYPPGIEYIAAFMGCLYGGVTAVPAYPPHPAKVERTFPRLHAICVDASPSIALTTAAILPTAETLFSQAVDTQDMCWLATDTLENNPANKWQTPRLNRDSLAFLQYTSGSTATPKGVMLTHHNLLSNLELIHTCFNISPDDRCVIWLPPYHDMGLIGGILQPLYGGFPVTLMSPVAFLQNPMRWLQTISHDQATISGGPNFAYELCAQKITPEQRATLDLSCWSVAFNGAEPIQPATLEKFASTFADCGFRPEAFYPCYGLAEATLIVSGGQRSAYPVIRNFSKKALEQNRVAEMASDGDDSRAFVGCGQKLPGQEIIIVEPNTHRLCSPEQIGEIWLSGPSISHGYWNRPEENEQAFKAEIDSVGDGPFFRTGDLGFWMDGELFIASRLKDLIIIRGQNHYPQDIEKTATQSHPGLRPSGGAAFSVDVAGDEHLVVVHEVERHYRKADPQEIFASIRQAVAKQHDIQVYAVVLIKTGSLPKTSSGKVQRRACRQMFLEGNLEIIASSQFDSQDTIIEDAGEGFSRQTITALAPQAQQPWLEAELHKRVAHALRIAPARFNVNTPLNTLGLDSLAAIQLAGELESQLGIPISMANLLQGASVTQITSQVLDALHQPDSSPAIQPLSPEQRRQYPLTRGQQALWFLNRLAPDSAAYNLTRAFRIQGKVDISAFRRTLQGLLERHPALRTVFIATSGDPIQQVQDDAQVDFSVTDATTWHETFLQQRLSEDSQRSFDLEHGPLLRIGLYERMNSEYILLVVFHHIVSDFWSFAVLFDELNTLYQAEVHGQSGMLSPMPAIGYADYVQWQKDFLTGPEGERLWAYWQNRLAGELPHLNLPPDRPRPALQTYSGASCHFRLNQELTEQLNALGRAHEATRYTTLLAAFKALLYRYTGQPDIIVGSATAGRSRAEWASLVGYFVNPLPMRSKLSGEMTFIDLLKQVRQTVLGAFEHQDFPFALLVERLKPVRDLSYSPIFQAMFLLQKAPRHGSFDESIDSLALGEAGGHVKIGDLVLEALPLEQHIAQFDLTLAMAEVNGVLAGAIEYNTDLFEAATMERLTEHFCNLLNSIVADPSQRISQLALLSKAERNDLLIVRNQTQAPYPCQECIHELFEAQAAHTPHAIAVCAAGEQLTYQDLNARANQLAYTLRKRGVGPEKLVGVCLERSIDLLITLLAILKAGGAYIPLDPAYPPERIAWMLEDAQASILLSQQKLLDRLPASAAPALCLDTLRSEITAAETANPVSGISSQNLAYVLYTSGSTGRPKGVAIAHQSAVCLIEWAKVIFSPADLASVLASTSICFDLSVFELFAPLSCGGQVILAENLLQFPHLPAAQQVTLINTVPSAMTDLLRTGFFPASVRTVNLAGEPLPGKLVQQIYQHPTTQRVFNLYGPSEDTTYSTFAWVKQGEEKFPAIGRPITNTQVYLLDTYLQPVPTGLPGELYLGGAGLARGYLNRPDLTAERFVPNPFGNQTGARLYKTGDLARYRTNGDLEYLGRVDHQVKIRGFRIELGEIETWLGRHPGVHDAAVIVYEDPPGDRRLVAYVVPESPVDRVPTQHFCQVEFYQDADGQQFELSLENLSYGGACLSGVPDTCEGGQAVRLRLQLSGSTDLLSLPGSIAWRRGKRAGVQFNAPSVEQTRLRQSVDQMLQTPPLSAPFPQASRFRALLQNTCWASSNNEADIELHIENLSSEGVCLTGVPGTWACEQKIHLRLLPLAEIAEELRLTGHVAWRQGKTAGIIFEADPVEQELLSQMLEGVHTSQNLSTNRLRDFLKQHLPDYMVPSTFMRLNAMPMTLNGKIDRRALPAPEQLRPTLDQIFVAPRTPEEETLAKIWMDVLKVDRVGIHDNFFDLGGHSLLATQVISRVRDAFNTEPPLHVLFEEPTVARLAGAIERERKLQPRQNTPPLRPRQRKNAYMEQILTGITQLSDEEAQQALREKKLRNPHD